MELRAGARQKATYRIRWITPLVFCGLLAWLIWAFNGFRAPQIFRAYSILIFLYCLILGTARTADCLSSEKREGTLGLLFLTNLNAPEIIGGKWCSNALGAAYGLFAIFPLLALQMLIGGVTLAQFWRTFLAMADALRTESVYRCTPLRVARNVVEHPCGWGADRQLCGRKPMSS